MDYGKKRFKIWEILRDAKEGERFRILNTNHSLYHWDNVVIRCVTFKKSKTIVFETAPNKTSHKKGKCVPLYGIVTECYWEKIETVDDFYEFIRNRMSFSSRVLPKSDEIKSWFEEYFGGPIKRLDAEIYDEEENGCDF